MLKTLFIKNYALIDEQYITFNKGFSVISGETGAGKSILLGALSLILGNRADTASLRNKNKKCIVESVFEISEYKLEKFFSENDIDFEQNTIIRREISTTGKSRAFINDTPVNLQVLKSLSLNLIDIHSQHKNPEINDFKFQLKVIDAFAGTRKLVENYINKFNIYNQTQKTYKELSEKLKKENSDADYFQFRYNELEQADLKENEQAGLEQEQKKLEYAEDIKSILTTTYNLLSDETHGIMSGLNEAVSLMNKAKQYYGKSEEFYNRLNSVEIELVDLVSEIENENADVEISPERMDFVNGRLDLLYSLQQKHNANSVSELMEIKNNLQEKLNSITGSGEKLNEYENLLSGQKAELFEIAGKISEKRLKVFNKLTSTVSKQLVELGIPAAEFVISHEISENLTNTGIDIVKFLFSANKNMPVMEISKVASGGEISRLMLSIKSLVANSVALPTIIFDEIDTGVSGEIAEKMGNIMKKISDNLQVIDITHLPQVAARADYQYLVYKEHTKDSTTTNIKLLGEAERMKEIAKMLSGENITEAAYENAKVLLGIN